MKEFYIVANSFAAPWFSDTSSKFVKAGTPQAALEKFAKYYKHPAGLYAAACYKDANSEAKGKKPLARWLSNHVAALAMLDHGSYLGHGPGNFEIDGVLWSIDEPLKGAVYP